MNSGPDNLVTIGKSSTDSDTLDESSNEFVKEAKWWHREGSELVCELCPRYCKLSEGQRGFCFVRENRDGEMVLATYGKSTGFAIDPIEKKPLNHFLPGTAVFSFGTAGCYVNFASGE